MGCCQSTSRDDAQSSPYSPSHPHADSLRAITSAPLPVANTSSSRVSTSGVVPPRHSRRPVGLGDQFNEPLRPHVWTSTRQWTRRELDREREEFFDTTVTGRQEIWGTLNAVTGLVLEGEIETAQGILDASGVTLPTGDLINGAYDEVGNFYQMPEHVISDPVNMALRSQGDINKGEALKSECEAKEDELERRREEKGKGILKTGETVRVRARLSDRGGPDITVTMGKEQNVRSLIRMVQEEASIPPNVKIKVAYLGRILKETGSLQSQGWKEGHVVNVLVFQ